MTSHEEIIDLSLDDFERKREFKDPYDKEQTNNLLREINELDDDEFVMFANTHFPKWIRKIGSSFASNVYGAQSSWVQMCRMLCVEPKEVVIITKMPQSGNGMENNEYKCLNLLFDRMTQRGFSLRGGDHLDLCRRCEAITSGVCPCNK